MIVGVSPADPTCELTRTEYVRVGTQHALLKRIVEAAAIDTVIDTRLVVDSAAASPRAAHENNVIGTMNILAACGGPDSPVRKVVFKSSAHYYGCERDDPAYFTEAMRRPHPPRTPIEQDIVEAERAVAAFARAQPRRDGHGAALRQRPGPGPAHEPHRAAVAPRRAVDPRLRPALPVHRRGRHLRRARARDPPRPARRLQRRRPTACSRSPRSPRCSASRSRRSCRRGGPGSPPARCAAPACSIPPEMLQQLRYGRALDNRRLKAAGYAFRRDVARDGAGVRRAPARARPAVRRRARATSTSARSRSSCAGAPPCGATTGSASAGSAAISSRSWRARWRPCRARRAWRRAGRRRTRRHVADRLALLLRRGGRRGARRRPVVGDVEDADLAERDRAGADELDHPQRDVRVELLAGRLLELARAPSRPPCRGGTGATTSSPRTRRRRRARGWRAGCRRPRACRGSRGRPSARAGRAPTRRSPACPAPSMMSRPSVGVALHLEELVVGQPRGLEQHRVGDADLADVVQDAGGPDLVDLLLRHAELARRGPRAYWATRAECWCV